MSKLILIIFLRLYNYSFRGLPDLAIRICPNIHEKKFPDTVGSYFKSIIQ